MITFTTKLSIDVDGIYAPDSDGVYPLDLEIEEIENLQEILRERFWNDTKLFELMCDAYINDSFIGVIGTKEADKEKLIENYLRILINLPDNNGNMLDNEVIEILKEWRKAEKMPYTDEDGFYWQKLINQMPEPLNISIASPPEIELL